METVTLYRPMGEAELQLIAAAEWRAFPPRLPEQPIFYPVLRVGYAEQIAREWNTRDGGTGYVVRFAVEKAYLDRYPVQIAGAREHQEYWIPAEDLAEFNRHIAGSIEVIARFGPGERGQSEPTFGGSVDVRSGLAPGSSPVRLRRFRQSAASRITLFQALSA